MEFFTEIVDGTRQVPIRPYKIKKSYSKLYDARFLNYLERYCKNATNFWKHFYASIPYIAEEHVRWAFAIEQYRTSKNRNLSIFAPENADACDMRTLLEFFPSKYEIIVNSGTFESSAQVIESHSPNIKVFRGCYQDYSPNAYLQAKDSPGILFDIMIVNVAMQFTKQSRMDQLRFLSQLVKSDGLYIILEKLNPTTSSKWLYHEVKKDLLYKTKYFHISQIREKRKRLLDDMTRNLVSADVLEAAFQAHFTHYEKIWSYGNFSAYACSNNLQNLSSFVEGLERPFCPAY